MRIKTMRIEDVMTKNVQSCKPTDTLQHAAQLTWEHDCGCLPVRMPGDGMERTVGVITDRDICMRAMFSGKALQELRVEEAMAKQVLTCQPSDTLDHAEKVMRGGPVERKSAMRALPFLESETLSARMHAACRRARAQKA